MIGNSSGANKENGELGSRVAFSRSKPWAWVVFEVYTPQDFSLSGDDINDRLEVTLDFAVLVIGCAWF